MEEGIINIYNNFYIFNNFKLIQNQNNNFECKKWIDELKKIQSLYTLNTKYVDNKTLLFGYQSTSQLIIPLDHIVSNFCTVIPKNCNNFVDVLIIEFVGFLVNYMKSKSTFDVANEIKYLLSIYLPITHVDNQKLKNHPYFEQNGNQTKITYLGRTLQEDHFRYDMIFKFDNNWNLIPGIVKNNNIYNNGVVYQSSIMQMS